MQLTPWYGSDPLITVDSEPGAVAGPAIRQRRRLVDALAELDDADWSRPSRCAGWTVRDVVVHLDSTNAFWSFSIRRGLEGDPTSFLATFDPVSSPAELVAAAGDPSPAEVLERFRASTESLAETVGGVGDAWGATAEAPVGHVSVDAVVHHALWDSWVHERDVLEPLGVEQVAEADEVEASLRYAAALAPAFALSKGRGGPATMVVEARDPVLSFKVDVGRSVHVGDGPAPDADLVLRGRAVDLAEALSVRRPLDQQVDDSVSWLVDGVAEVFDQRP